MWRCVAYAVCDAPKSNYVLVSGVLSCYVAGDLERRFKLRIAAETELAFQASRRPDPEDDDGAAGEGKTGKA